MENVKLNLNEKGYGNFFIMDGKEQIAEMVVEVADEVMTVYHTEVLPKAEGKGIAKQLLTAMVDYARNKGLKVTALCPYVHAQFSRHPEEYQDIWKRS